MVPLLLVLLLHTTQLRSSKGNESPGFCMLDPRPTIVASVLHANCLYSVLYHNMSEHYYAVYTIIRYNRAIISTVMFLMLIQNTILLRSSIVARIFDIAWKCIDFGISRYDFISLFKRKTFVYEFIDSYVEANVIKRSNLFNLVVWTWLISDGFSDNRTWLISDITIGYIVCRFYEARVSFSVSGQINVQGTIIQISEIWVSCTFFEQQYVNWIFSLKKVPRLSVNVVL